MTVLEIVVFAIFVIVPLFSLVFLLYLARKWRRWEEYLQLYLSQLAETHRDFFADWDKKGVESKIGDIEDRLSNTTRAFERFRSKLNMREVRDRPKKEDEPPKAETPQEWKQRMRRQIALGQAHLAEPPRDHKED